MQSSLFSNNSLENNTINTMSGFTADFFGALETTFTDGSQNNSKLSQSNGNKAYLMQEIRQQSALKISQLLSKMIKIMVFEQVYLTSQRKRRREQRTPLGMHKVGYKIQLLFKVKNNAKMKWAFHRLQKFTQQNDMRLINPVSTKDTVQKQIKYQISQISQFVRIITVQITRRKHLDMQIAFIKIKNKGKNKQQRNPNLKNVNLQNVIKLTNIVFKIWSQKKVLRNSFKAIRDYQNYLDKKEYFIKMIIMVAHKNLRWAFLALQNAQKSVFKLKKKQSKVLQQKAQISDQPKNVVQKISSKYENIINIQKKQSKQSYGINDNNKLKETKLQKQIFSQNQKINNEITKQATHQSKKHRPNSGGLKFNRCFKKKSESSIKKQERKTPRQSTILNDNDMPTPLISKKKSTILTTNQCKIIKIQNIKSIKIVKQLHDCAIPKNKTIWKDFCQFNKIYHLNSHELKRQVPDIQDQILQAQQKLSSSRSSSNEQKLVFSRRLHVLQNKRPLQFSGKKHKSKSKMSSQKSKKSIHKSDQQEPQTVNMQSLKSYYFPYQQKYGKAQVNNHVYPSSTKFIGSENWNGQSKKKRVATQSNIATFKSAQKVNPYLQQLKQKISRKPSQRVVSLHRAIQRSNSGRSQSKNSKKSRQSQKSHKRTQPKKPQTKKQQINHYNKNQIMPSHLQTKSRNISPAPKYRTQSTKTPASVPREWCFYNGNTNVASAVHSPKSSGVQFQRNVYQNNGLNRNNQISNNVHQQNYVLKNNNGNYRNNFQ